MQAVLLFSHGKKCSFKRLKGRSLYQIQPAGLLCLDIESRVNFVKLCMERCVLSFWMSSRYMSKHGMKVSLASGEQKFVLAHGKPAAQM